jgi:hypothetical protein
MTRNEQELTTALRALAESTPREAPPELEARLAVAFRRESRKRKLLRWVPVIAATAAAAAVLITLVRAPSTPAAPAAITYKIAPPELTVATTVAATPRRPRPARRPQPPAEIATGFFTLPEARDLFPAEAETVVRVQLPRYTMRLVGLPVNEERANERIRADMVFGQDGIARAVRFVQ